MDTQSLDDILNDVPAEATQVEAAPEAPPAPELDAGGPIRDEQGRFAAKTGVEDTPPPGRLPQEEYKAIREEREKRQALERDMEALKAQLQSFQQPKAEPEPIPTIWDDDQAALAHNRQEAVTEARFQARLDMSEMLAAQAHDDFDDVKAKFLEMAQGNPALAQQALEAKHPWEKAYQIAKNAATMAELGATNLDELRAKIREELMAEQQAIPPVRPTLPPTLTTERNVGARSGPAWSGPAPLRDLLR
jgi:hypothetical protein